MNNSASRFFFAGLCLVCLVAIWCGALFEIGRQKRAATISKRHFRWRMMSALLWTLILGSFAYATLFSWPLNIADKVTARRFIALTSGATVLILPAFALIIFDFYLTVQTRRIQTVRMNQDLGEIARREIERAQAEAQNRETQNSEIQGGNAP
ncbi:hypothetical protein B1R32_103137 [Abditibacterium utsteinense]|uniref:Uncharacterized protein n=1 Tax=Abditibacterium utsteinense TaxID=1960156 RepID=A0A2S8SVP8_9BACT|nr:hypothetical protein [Abditibacterium utsteinense]PQV64870.1 hypothetical protein B1R32_103137 [Abditibacterium utsteinense]